MKTRGFLLAIILALASACSARPALGQTQMFGLVQVQPTVIHYVIFTQMEQCTGKKGDYTKIHWFVAQSIVAKAFDGTQVTADGLYYMTDMGPVIVFQYEAWDDGETISHEIMHSLFKGDVPLDVAQHCMFTWKNAHPV